MARTNSLAKPYSHKPNEPWKLRHFGFNRPEEHPNIAFGPRGRVIMEAGQVWVEDHTQKLWTVTYMRINEARRHNSPLYPHDVTLKAFRGVETRSLAETSVRRSFTVWDAYIKRMVESRSKLRRMSGTANDSPWRGDPDASERAGIFFRLDRYGFRTD
jgi:hypothetical protein